jgi:hypothetical protein
VRVVFREAAVLGDLFRALVVDRASDRHTYARGPRGIIAAAAQRRGHCAYVVLRAPRPRARGM